MIRNSQSKIEKTKNGLYLVSTPIGNLRDITLRAIEILKKSDYILCEDTRISKNLLKRYEVESKLISNHKFNEKKNVSKLVKLLKEGSIISMISDAGTPTISDPGKILINECINNKIDIIPLPGPSSVLSAVSISGFSDKFFFYGFFPEKKKILEEDLKSLSLLNSSIVFFISAKKINKMITNLKLFFKNRKIVICREMTKYYEEFIRCDINDLEKIDLELKGEFTIVISEKNLDNKISQSLNESDKRMISQIINKISIKEIVNLISQNRKISKKEIYNYCLKLKNEN
tara:strand:+ start:76 stop:939 length:864 start_codon:yes stop_codon:yes gene_type:complete